MTNPTYVTGAVILDGAIYDVDNNQNFGWEPYIGSGILVGNNLVLTAGDVVYSYDQAHNANPAAINIADIQSRGEYFGPRCGD